MRPCPPPSRISRIDAGKEDGGFATHFDGRAGSTLLTRIAHRDAAADAHHHSHVVLDEGDGRAQ